MDFSICLASRSRVGLLSNLLESVEQLTLNLDQVEVLVGYDFCDNETRQASIALSEKYKFVRFFGRDRSPYLNRDYLNYACSNLSSGKYCIAFNDDVEIRTKNWDVLLKNKIEEYCLIKTDRIAYVFTSDGLLNRQNMGYSCFPCVTREGVDALGFFMPGEYPGWHADVILWKIYQGINRILDCSEVEFFHNSYHAGVRPRDEINKYVAKISNVHVPFQLEKEIAKLEDKILVEDFLMSAMK